MNENCQHVEAMHVCDVVHLNRLSQKLALITSPLTTHKHRWVYVHIKYAANNIKYHNRCDSRIEWFLQHYLLAMVANKSAYHVKITVSNHCCSTSNRRVNFLVWRSNLPASPSVAILSNCMMGLDYQIRKFHTSFSLNKLHLLWTKF